MWVYVWMVSIHETREYYIKWTWKIGGIVVGGIKVCTVESKKNRGK